MWTPTIEKIQTLCEFIGNKKEKFKLYAITYRQWSFRCHKRVFLLDVGCASPLLCLACGADSNLLFSIVCGGFLAGRLHCSSFWSHYAGAGDGDGEETEAEFENERNGRIRRDRETLGIFTTVMGLWLVFQFMLVGGYVLGLNQYWPCQGIKNIFINPVFNAPDQRYKSLSPRVTSQRRQRNKD